VCESEVAQAEAIIAQFGLTGARRQEAITLFKEGSADEFELEPQISDFMLVARTQPLLRQMLLEALLTMALADGEVDSAEKTILLRVAGYIGVSARDFQRLLDMAMAQRQFQGRGAGGQQSARSSASELQAAYKAIGVGND
jgi:DnaJ like chaperone protein